jgi:dodecin
MPVRRGTRKEGFMSVARVTEISATNSESFEAAINEGIRRATSTLRNVEGAWVKDMNVLIQNNNIIGYKVNLAVTFVLEDTQDIS